ncbi:methionine aminopeptidase [Cyclospora cayetanensis]|uniref:Methionine aminopeptidase n=1 Tax=Cyclospora cayetanensis TaxID=88456 RepID=A0A1D3D1U5_9EIME|nr:methionine aminopeptidase [Cyclospora cayetanensis]
MPEPLTEEEIARLRAACRSARFVLDSCMSLLSPPLELGGLSQHSQPELHGNGFIWRGPHGGPWPSQWISAATEVAALCTASKLPLSGLLIDFFCHRVALAIGAFPSPLGYKGYPRSCCVSLDHVLCHVGIPSSTPLEPGSLVSVDVTLFLDGFHGDCCASALYTPPPEASEDLPLQTSSPFSRGSLERKKRLIEVAKKATQRGIDACREGAPLSVIGRAIESFLGSEGFYSPPALCGHGIGRRFHQPPLIHHTWAPFASGSFYQGLAFTVEPVVCPSATDLKLEADQWTVSATNKLPGAQFEETVLIGAQGPEILTKP